MSRGRVQRALHEANHAGFCPGAVTDGHHDIGPFRRGEADNRGGSLMRIVEKINRSDDHVLSGSTRTYCRCPRGDFLQRYHSRSDKPCEHDDPVGRDRCGVTKYTRTQIRSRIRWPHRSRSPRVDPSRRATPMLRMGTRRARPRYGGPRLSGPTRGKGEPASGTHPQGRVQAPATVFGVNRVLSAFGHTSGPSVADA